MKEWILVALLVLGIHGSINSEHHFAYEPGPGPMSTKNVSYIAGPGPMTVKIVVSEKVSHPTSIVAEQGNDAERLSC
ncbi:hypothetical protein [Tumebacillus lipolyticus]|uniref:Uncharacterized protein n=1 Tax=Tumebacillus lipolyticus TaxID=1280370 RepID=A0ABW4ZUS3_9BACL